MALSYLDSATLMSDPVFTSRVKVACLTFAAYIANEATTTPAHNTRMRWATNTLQQPDTAAAAVMPMVVMDPNVQSAGSDITDAALQSAVETAVNKLL